MKNANLLLLSTNRKSREVLPGALHNHNQGLAVDAVGRVTEAAERLASGLYDAVVCCADTSDELALVIGIKRRHPGKPIVLLSRVPDSGFEPIARSVGADSVVRKSGGLEDTVRELLHNLQAARESRIHSLPQKEVARGLRKAGREHRDLISLALGLAAAEEPSFTTLLVEDDPLESALLVGMLARAKLPPFVRTASTVGEAIEYLSGRGRYSDRAEFPLPALIVSDLNLPVQSGLDLLRRVRSSPETQHLGFIMLTSSERESDIESAYENGANLYLTKSPNMHEAVEVIRDVYLRYMAERTGSNRV